MMFLFMGKQRADTHWKCDAPNLQRAIRMFRVGALFPHSYSSAPVWEEDSGEQGGWSGELYKVARSSEPGAVVQVYAGGWDDEHLVAEILPEAPETDDFTPAMLADMGLPTEALAVEGEGTTALAPAGAMAGIGNTTRRGIETKQLELRRALRALERQKRELQHLAGQLRAEVTRRLEQVWLIELFLGSKEEVLVLRDGAPAPEGTPITVFQRVLCMDEEYAVAQLYGTADAEKGAGLGQFDSEYIERFDTWLLRSPAHLDAILPAAKGLRALRVRRHKKEREAKDFGQAWQAAHLSVLDTNTYLLIRNGESIYRLWVDVDLWPRLVPRATEFDPPKPRTDDSFALFETQRAEERARAAMKNYAAGFLVINGLVQRSTLLHPLPPTDHPINVFNTKDVEQHFKLVLDDEGQRLLGDGRVHEHVTWASYRKWLDAQLADGVRVIWRGRDMFDPKELYLRTGIQSLFSWPDPADVYTLELEAVTAFGPRYRIKYLPRDEVWVRDDYGAKPVQRTRRVSFAVNSHECVPIDFLSWRVLEHLIRDRAQREAYESFFWVAFSFRKLAKEAADRERPFVDLVFTRCGVNLTDDEERARCERLVRWWKLKVKEHRTLGTDEAKALRMIERAFKNGEDHDNDPETLLTSS